MQTRLSVFCDKVIEAGWLAALVIVPLFFNIYSQRVFEPDKLTLLRSLALVMCCAWLIRAIEDWRMGRKHDGPRVSLGKRIVRTPMVLPTLLLVAIYVLTSLTSIDLKVSLLGSYQRLQGTYTTLAYIVIFFLMLESLRSKRQLNRVITAVVLVSFPIAMYGLVQHFGLDPLPWGGNVTTRVASNMGNAIFVGAFLILVVPLTLSRLLENWKEAIGPFELRDGLLGLAAFALLAAALLAGMLLRQGASLPWLRWVALAVGVGLQVPIYLLSAPERRSRVLAISLPATFAFLVGFSWILEIFFPPEAGADVSRYLWLGILASVVFIVAMVAFAFYLRKPVARLVLLAAYAVILIAQVACIFYTQSRGPLLGLVGGMLFYLALLGLVKRRLWLPWLTTGAAVLVVVILVLFNTADWPLIEKLRETPYIGRLGKVLQTEEGTGKVRVLIWQGVTDMIAPHSPLVWPGENAGTDRLNALRPLLGYGPESMYVAYNSFYPPDLAHYEKRNASPDRSHNETFDALVTTGIAGFVVYMLVFASAFFYGLKWLGLIRSPGQRWTFVGLWIGGGAVGIVAPLALSRPEYIGVGVPVGVMLGLAAYVFIMLIAASREGLVHPQPRGLPSASGTAGERDLGPAEAGERNPGGRYALWLVALVAAIVAHFIEIHFGIAIAATRTTFWVYTALLVVIGTRLAGAERPQAEATAELAATQAVARPGQESAAQKRTKASQPAAQARRGVAARGEKASGSGQKRRPAPAVQTASRLADDWLGSVWMWTLVAILMLGTMLFDWVTVQEDAGVLATIWKSLTGETPIMLVLVLATWGMVALVGLSDLATRDESTGKTAAHWLRGLGVFALVTAFGTLAFGLWHAWHLKPVTLASADAPNPIADTITGYYLFAGLIVAGLAAVLTWGFRRVTAPGRAPWHLRSLPADLVAIVSWAAVPVTVLLILASNLVVVRADILYKQGLSSEKAGEWDGAVFFYDQALALTPDQDFYYLFLGRALMEKGRAAEAADRDALLAESEQALLRARDIAPLNTDHSANLGRLYRTWGSLSLEEERTERLETALGYYADANRLSPNNAQLLNEWGQTYQALGDYDQAMEKFEQSLALDPRFATTLGLVAEMYMEREQWAEAIQAYQQAIEMAPNSADAYSSMGYAYSQQQDLDSALEAYQKAADLKPNVFTHRKNLAIILQQLGRIEDAVREATQALKLAPENQKESMQSYLAQLQSLISGLSEEEAAQVQELMVLGGTQTDGEEWAGAEDSFRQVLEIDPNNSQAHAGLAYVYAKQGKVDQAITENLAVLDLVGEDYGSLRNLAVLYQQKGETEKAIAAAEQALALAPEADKQALTDYLDQLKQATGTPAPTPGATEKAGDLPPAERNEMYSAAPKMNLDPDKTYQATIVTDKGNLVLDLLAEQAPNTVNNFVFLAREGYFDNTTFHRVLPGFMAQAGDPTGTGRGGPGYRFADEIASGLRFDAPGVLAMANSGPNTNGSQFFITYAAAPWLDGSYSIFGRLVEGMEVLKAITPRDPQQNPKFTGDTIQTITITEK